MVVEPPSTGGSEKKKSAYKAIYMYEGKGDLQEYKRLKREAKREVAKAKERAWKEWYAKLNNIEGGDQIYRIAKSRAKQKKISPRRQESKTSWTVLSQRMIKRGKITGILHRTAEYRKWKRTIAKDK